MLERLIVNWPLKLLSLAIALGIWLTVTGEARVVQDFMVPLDIHLPATRIATVDLPNTVTVRLRGPESAMRRLDPIPLSVNVDLPADVAIGTQNVQLLADHVVGVPRGVDVDFVDPGRLSLQIETRVTKEVPIEPTFLGEPPEGFAFYGAQVRPEKVTVEGPASRIEAMTEVRTNGIRLDQRRKRFVVNVGVVPDGDYVRVREPGPARVVVDVDAAPVQRRFAGVPIRSSRSVNGAVIEPPLADITVSGPARLLDRLDRTRLRASVDTRGLSPRKEPYTLAISVDFTDIPVEDIERVTVKAIEPREVAVRLTDRRTSE